MSVSNVPSVLAGASSKTDRRDLGKNEFLTLLVTQLRNQDPLSPLQPHEFAAQLAQFTSVEQLTQLNAGMLRQEESLAMATLLSKTSFSAALIGRRVAANGNQVAITADAPANVRIEVGGSGGNAKLTLRDASGREVATRDLGSLTAGRHTLTLPAGLPPGVYRYTVAVSGPNGAAVPVTTYTTGVVDGISFLDGRIVLRIGAMEIDLDDLAEVEPAAPSGAGSPGDPVRAPHVTTPIPFEPPLPNPGDLID